jgi:hypothetical protein
MPPADNLPDTPVSDAGSNTGTPRSGADTALNDPENGDPVPLKNWPENWRALAAGDDEKKLKQLERYASPEAALSALFAAQGKIRSGELKSVLKPDATPEELTAWRVENGIPESPDKYDLDLGEGVVLGEEDKPLVDELLKTAHEANVHPTQLKSILKWALAKNQAIAETTAEQDLEVREATVETLRGEWGQDYKRNIRLARGVLSSIPGIPEGFPEMFMAARDPNGVALGNNADVLRWLTGIALTVNPDATIAPAKGSSQMQSLEEEAAGLRKLMGDHASEYWRGPLAAKRQARYREIVGLLQKAK